MHTWRYAVGLAALTGVLAAMAAWAADADESAIPADKQAKWLKRYPEMDADGDGTLTRQEARQFREARRGASPDDSGQGGPPGEGPGKRHRRGGFYRPDPARVLQEHPQADTDGDGTLSKEEMRAFGQSRMEQRRKDLLHDHPELDTDKDGALSEEEMKAARAKYPWLGGGPPQFRPHPGFFGWLIQRFTEADLDGNNQLSRQELTKLKEKYAARGEATFRPGFGDRGPLHRPLLERFPEADTDGDGRLSDEELRALKEKHPGAGGGRGHKGKGLRRGSPDQAQDADPRP